MTMGQPSENTDFPLMTTLRRLDRLHHCERGRIRLATYLGKTRPDDEPLPFEEVLNAVGLLMATNCCPAEPDHERHWRRFAVWCARQVEHLIQSPECASALDVAERFCNGEATDLELAEAAAAAWATAPDVDDFPGFLAIRRANEAAANAASCLIPNRSLMAGSTPVLSVAAAVLDAFGLHSATMHSREADVVSQVNESAGIKKYNERAMLDRLKAAFRLLVTEGNLP